MEGKNIQLGLKENWKQFTLLLIVNAFVGGMVGLERTVLPKVAEKEFLIVATSVVLSFIIVFGVVKAIANYFTGALANSIGRKNLLIIGWISAIPIPFILMYAQHWNWIIFANVLLGINQGLTWSSTVVMKIDLVGEKHRGLAMGLNESFGYFSIALVAFTTGWIASEYGLRPYPFYQGIGFVMLGLLINIFFIKDTAKHVAAETEINDIKSLKNTFWDTTWRDNNLGSISQAGSINNLNDGMIWGVLPIILASRGFNLKSIAIIVAIYRAVWGIGQLITGKLSDHYNKKRCYL
jgi:MFS family permease